MTEEALEKQSVRPFWEGTAVFREAVAMVRRKSALPEARLLFPPVKILCVESARLDRTYAEAEDWVFADGVLRLTENSRIPFLTEEELYPDRPVPGLAMPRRAGGSVLFREGPFFHDRQIVVTYTHAELPWGGPVPAPAAVLTQTFAKLRRRQPLKLLLYGDSISEGSNSSGYLGVPPYLPPWGRLVANELARFYGTSVLFQNPSVGGKTSRWGAENAEQLAAVRQPDLTLIAFGMNDGCGTRCGDSTPPSVFRQNIRQIMACIRAHNPRAEFILVSPTLPNPETYFYDLQPRYPAELNALSEEYRGAAAADMTGVHAALLARKSFPDMTGNHINHPNDYLSRWYAQFILGMLKARP